MKMYEYYKSDSVIHKLNPLVKIIWLVALSVIVLLSDNLMLLLGTLLLMLIVQVVSKIPWKLFAQYLLYLLFFAAFVSLVIILTKQGYSLGVLFLLKLSALMVSAVQFTLTTSKKELMIALIKLKIPYSFAYALSIAFRFLPLIVKEFKEVSNAQKIRGHKVRFSIIHPLNSAQSFIPIITPLFIILLNKSLELSIASDSRGFTPKAYSLQNLEFRSIDLMAIVLLIIVIIGNILY